MTRKQAKEKIKPFITACEKDGDEYYIFHHTGKHNTNLVNAFIGDKEAVGILAEIIGQHPEAFNYLIEHLNKKKIIAKA